MAKTTISFPAQSDYLLRLEKLGQLVVADDVLEEAVYAGAAVIADAIRDNLASIPEDRFRLLDDGEVFRGLPAVQKRDLLDSFGLAPIGRDRNGYINTRAGFDGYGSYPTKTYPKGIPNQLLARVVESGSSVRIKHPFVRPAVRYKRTEAIAAMAKVIDKAISEIFE